MVSVEGWLMSFAQYYNSNKAAGISHSFYPTGNLYKNKMTSAVILHSGYRKNQDTCEIALILSSGQKGLLYSI